MAIVKVRGDQFTAALEPGIVSLVVSAFEIKLEEKLNGIIDEVYAELRDELPKKIKATVHRAFSPDIGGENFNIEVNFTGLDDEHTG